MKNVLYLVGTVVVVFAVLWLASQANPQSQAGAQDPPRPSDDLSQLGGLDPIGQALVRERTKSAELEARVERLEWYISLQRRQVKQLQDTVFRGYRPRGVIGDAGPGADGEPIVEPEMPEEFGELPPIGQQTEN